MAPDVYSFDAVTLGGRNRSLSEYKGKTLLIVNTASKCGFTPQYKGLQELYSRYQQHGLEILGFPCNQFQNQEPGDEQEIQKFCELNYGVTFPMFAKIDVNGDNTHPLFEYLKTELPGLAGSRKIKWNFTKFLVDSEGRPLKRYGPATKPSQIESDIRKLLVD